MQYAIPIHENTVAFIGEYLNNGVVPEVEARETVFLLKGNDEVPEIVYASDFWGKYSIIDLDKIYVFVEKD